jgi:hypothetical protein
LEYKGLFNKIVALLSSPAKAWNEISEETDTRSVMENFVYPLIGLCGLSVFIGCFIGNTAGANEAFQVAMKRCCATCISLFGGFFLASYLSDLLGKKLLGRESEMEQNRCFIGYSMVVTFVLQIISGLFSISILHWILQFYTVFVVYEGANVLMKVEEKRLTHYALLVSLLVLLCPAVISTIFDKLSMIV